jgi:cyclophilin family peptidyl-prolyl cis-trans isomerase
MKRTCLALVGLFAGILTATAQNTPPVVTNQIADFTEYLTTQRSVNLTTAFADSDVSVAVRMSTVLGDVDIALFGQQKPITVANFLNYLDSGRYFIDDSTAHQVASSFVHRSIPGFVIQGGGFLGTVNGANTAIQPTEVLAFPPIQNEPGISNKRGTIAMAQSGTDANSATSQWFINLADNGGPPNNLDIRNNNAGPYTVFGRVAGNGMTVVDAIAAVPRYNFSSVNPNFSNLPLRNWNGTSAVKVSNLVSIPGLTRISPLNFSAMSSNANVSVAVSGTNLLVTGNQAGSALVTVTATDLDGATVSQSFTVTVIAAPGRLVQISTRMQVGTGDNVLIGGFIMRGSAPKRLMIRGVGPSSGLAGALADPILELHDGTGAIVASNDNWGDAANKQDMIDTGLAPTSPNESAILSTLPSDPTNAFYTAIVRGVNNGTGLGLVEVYDVDSGPGSTLLNISTRGLVNLDPDVLIGGFFVGGADPKQILVRASGPSLAAAGVPNPLANPTLSFFNGQGTQLDANDDWMTSPQKAQIQASGLAPTDPKESAVLQTLAAGPYTAVVRGVNNGTGVASVQIYQLN